VLPSANGYFLVWRDASDGSKIVGAHLDASLAGVEAAPVLLASDANLGSFTIAAAAGGGYLLLWARIVAGPIEGQLLDAKGAPVGSPFSVATAVSASPALYAVYGGGNYEVVTRSSGTRAARSALCA
jgi:hypothetical protein